MLVYTHSGRTIMSCTQPDSAQSAAAVGGQLAAHAALKLDRHFRTLRALAQQRHLLAYVQVCALLLHLSGFLASCFPAADIDAIFAVRCVLLVTLAAVVKEL